MPLPDLLPSCPPRPPRRDARVAHRSPSLLEFGLFWYASTHSKVNRTVHSMARCVLGMTRADKYVWFHDHNRSMRAAQDFVQASLGHTYRDQLIAPGSPRARSVGSETTHLRRMVAWQSAACHRQNSTHFRGLMISMWSDCVDICPTMFHHGFGSVPTLARYWFDLVSSLLSTWFRCGQEPGIKRHGGLF